MKTRKLSIEMILLEDIFNSRLVQYQVIIISVKHAQHNKCKPRMFKLNGKVPNAEEHQKKLPSKYSILDSVPGQP